jgi:hypothetical protein
MPCETKKKLTEQYESANWAFAQWGARNATTSERKRLALRKEASERRSRLANDLVLHAGSCEECKRDLLIRLDAPKRPAG